MERRLPTCDCDVMVINDNAFRECTQLTSANLDDGLEKIEKQASLSCSQLARVTLGEGLEVIGEHRCMRY